MVQRLIDELGLRCCNRFLTPLNSGNCSLRHNGLVDNLVQRPLLCDLHLLPLEHPSIIWETSTREVCSTMRSETRSRRVILSTWAVCSCICRTMIPTVSLTIRRSGVTEDLDGFCNGLHRRQHEPDVVEHLLRNSEDLPRPRGELGPEAGSQQRCF